MHANGLLRLTAGLAVALFLWAVTGCNYIYEQGTYTPRNPYAERRSELRNVK